MNDFPLFDGVAPSWADLSAKIAKNGARLFEAKDIAAINTGTQVTIGKQRGVGSIIRKRTTGSVAHTASIDFYRDGYDAAMRILAGFAPRRGLQAKVSLVVFDITYQWTPEADFRIYETRLKGVRLLGRDLNSTEGDDADQVSVPIDVMQIVDVDPLTGTEIAYL